MNTDLASNDLLNSIIHSNIFWKIILDFLFRKSCELQIITLRISVGEQAGCKLFLGDRKGAAPGLNVSDGGDWVHSDGRGQHGEVAHTATWDA